LCIPGEEPEVSSGTLSRNGQRDQNTASQHHHHQQQQQLQQGNVVRIFIIYVSVVARIIDTDFRLKRHIWFGCFEAASEAIPVKTGIAKH